MKKVHPAVSAVLFIIDAIMWFNEKANEVALNTYERAMNEGEGVLILTWEVSGSRCGYYSFVKYLPLSYGGV